MENSGISWTDHTQNDWIGCTKVSPGCDNCYAEREQDLRHGRAKWGKGNPRYLTSEANRKKPLSWERKAIAEGRRYKVFAQSLSDVFDEEVPDEWRDGLFETAAMTPHLDYLILTKRLAKMLRWVRANAPWLSPNISWGCSVENQAAADSRVPELLKLRDVLGPMPVLWLSVEPLLGRVDLKPWLPQDIAARRRACIDWVVVGGESGPAARPAHPDWVRLLRDQSVFSGVPFHFKQFGEFNQDGQRVGKQSAGRLLDGREWNDFPDFTR
jgi:protein gp37